MIPFDSIVESRKRFNSKSILFKRIRLHSAWKQHFRNKTVFISVPLGIELADAKKFNETVMVFLLWFMFNQLINRPCRMLRWVLFAFETHFRALTRDVIIVLRTNGADKCFETTHCDIYWRSYIKKKMYEKWKSKQPTSWGFKSVNECVCGFWCHQFMVLYYTHINFVAVCRDFNVGVMICDFSSLHQYKFCGMMSFNTMESMIQSQWFYLLSDRIKSEWNCFILSHLKPTVHYN